VEERGPDPLRRAGELLHQIDLDRTTRRELQARLAPVLRSRRPELEPARKAMQVLIDMLPNAHGPELDTLKQHAQHLAQPPPMSEEERRRRIAALQAEGIRIARLVNPYG
jgi:hypothetical protein